MLRLHCTPTAGILLTGALLVFGCNAQQAPRPEFEAASIKPTAIDSAQFRQLSMGGRIKLGAQIHGTTAEYVFITLRQFVAEAYQVMPSQIVCPDWFMNDRFDIVAKMPAGSRTQDARLMLQSLLEARFRLALHRESREELVAAVVVVPGGPRLTESPAGAESDPEARASKTPATAKSAGSFGGTMGNVAVRFTVDAVTSCVHLDVKNIKMTDLARFLMNFGAGNGRPVVDMTDLKGEYDMILDIPLSMLGLSAHEEGTASSGSAPPPRPADSASDPGTGTLLRSLKVYGLDLKNTKASLEHLVIDHADRKPTEN